ncbi:MAG: metal-sensitive transcriptional regulator [Chloroflexota bacterium]
MQEETTKREILRRLKSVEGHVRGIQRMVEEGQYCIDIINQSAAVQSAMDKVNALVLERHLQSCVATAVRSDDPAERERVIKELLQVFNGRGNLGRALQLVDDLAVSTEAPIEACHVDAH